MLKHHLKITLISDESISLNEFRVTLAGSDIDITDVIMRGESIDEVLEREGELVELESGKLDRSTLEYSKKNDRDDNSRPRNNGNSRASGGSANSNGKPNPRYSKS